MKHNEVTILFAGIIRLTAILWFVTFAADSIIGVVQGMQNHGNVAFPGTFFGWSRFYLVDLGLDLRIKNEMGTREVHIIAIWPRVVTTTVFAIGALFAIANPVSIARFLLPLRDQDAALKRKQEAEQAGTEQPATRSQSKSEGSDQPQPESEGRSR